MLQHVAFALAIREGYFVQWCFKIHVTSFMLFIFLFSTLTGNLLRLLRVVYFLITFETAYEKLND